MQPALKQLITEVSSLVQKATGVQLGANQTSMVQFRLTKRMTDLALSEPEDYRNYVHSNLDAEMKVLVSLLTTHHTFFFREYGHFEYLEREGLSRIIAEARKEGRKTLRVWSAACSRGQEVYSLSMFLKTQLSRLAPDFNYEIFGSDVDQESVDIGKNGVYRWDEIKEIPSIYLTNNWVRGTGDIADFAKAKDSIKAATKWKAINLFEISDTNPQGTYDLIFCRNVFIYFKADQIETITRSLMRHLAPHGLLFIGMSESLNGLKVPAIHLGPSVYCHEAYKKLLNAPAAAASALTRSTTATPATPTQASPAPMATTPSSSVPVATTLAGPIRVLCVDDSGTVLMLLKKILTKAEGFEVVATAENGLQAAEALKKHKVDAMTLDIHMPQQDGVEYLKQNFKPGSHPPVVMLSSVSREDSSLGLKALEYGATDYVEKPSLQNLAERGDEIRMKLRLALSTKQRPHSEQLRLAKSFAKEWHLNNVDGKLRILVGGLGDRDHIKEMIGSCKRPQPATVVLFHGSENLLANLSTQWEKEFGTVEFISEPPTKLESNKIYVGDFAKLFGSLKEKHSKIKTSVLIFGDVTGKMKELLPTWENAQLILEDRPTLSKSNSAIKEIASYCVPITSFKYHSDEFLCEGDK